MIDHTLANKMSQKLLVQKEIVFEHIGLMLHIHCFNKTTACHQTLLLSNYFVSFPPPTKFG